MKIEIRRVKKSELNDVIRVENEAWPEEIRAHLEKFESRISIFSQGFLAAYSNGTMAGVSTSQIIDYPNMDLTSWEKITDNGFITRSHNPKGNAIYVVSLGISNKYQGRGLGSKLIEAQKQLVNRLGLQFLVLGARIPMYHKHNTIPIHDYLKLKNEKGEPLDKELRFYLRTGLNIDRVVPNYMEDDPESLNYGVVMVWQNK